MHRIAQSFRLLAVALLATALLTGGRVRADEARPVPDAARAIPATVREQVIHSLLGRHGATHEARIRSGVAAAASFWRAEDGDTTAFAAFCLAQFISEPAVLETTFRRFESLLESVDGHMHEIDRDVNRPMQVEVGPGVPLDALFAELAPAAHVQDDLFKTRVAFVALLNFPVATLSEKLRTGPSWSREQWARARLADRFVSRVPGGVAQAVARVRVRAEDYISRYNIRMNNLVTRAGQRLFHRDLRLITHWGLRDEIKSWYPRPDGVMRQRMIAKVMERIVLQEIPAVVIDNAQVDWDPETNAVVPHDSSGPVRTLAEAPREADVRYAHLLGLFQAERLQDAWSPVYPTYLARCFDRDREMTEPQVEALLVSILTAPEVAQTARLLEKRLGRPLEPFDIWYNGFRGRQERSQEELDRFTRQRYPDAAAFRRDIPRILGVLGFSADTAAFVAGHVVVEPSRGAGHAMGASRRGDDAFLRTRVGAGGMDYKGYNIATHELGHCVEQTFSLYRVDHWLLHGVPNTAFTEAQAFVYQNRDLELLGLAGAPDAEARRLHALGTLWSTYEIAGVALLDMRVWRWMYAHPQATPAQLREATVSLARDIWNRYYAPVLGHRDSVLLAIYSHLIEIGLYVPDYAIGHLIAFQLEQFLEKEGVGRHQERMCRQGCISPDLWMQGAVGAPVSADPLLRAAGEALRQAR